MNANRSSERIEYRDPALERLIEGRTFGQVQSLRVDRTDSRVIVHGHAHSYYVVQLALAAVQAALERARTTVPQRVELDIDVGTST